MDSRLVLGVVLACACDARLKDAETTDASPTHDARTRDGVAIDGAGDAYVFGPWNTPAGVPGASDATKNMEDETVSSQLTELYFAINDPGLAGSPKQLWMMTRATA